MAPTTKTFIQKRDNVMGGDACVRDFRLPVWEIIEMIQQGSRNERILRAYPFLTLDDIECAVDYYRQNKLEIDSVIAENQAA